MISRRSLLFVALASAATGALAASSATAAKESTKKIAIENIQFNPTDVTIKLGETLEWENKDIVPHTVTADDGSFDSKTIDPGKTWSYKPKKKGTFSYKCNFHPNMLAKFSVK